MRYIVLLLSFVLAACTGEKVQGAPTEGEVIHIPAIKWYVVSQKELERAYAATGGQINEVKRGRHTLRDDLSGFAGTLDGYPVVITTPPRTVDDAVACTLGHEIMHVTLGPYHD